MSNTELETTEMFSGAATAQAYLESRLWLEGTSCPTCAGKGCVTTRKREGYYRCNNCQLDYTIRTGTILERSQVPLHKWIHVIYLLAIAQKNVSCLQIGKQLGISPKSVRFMLRRLREACGGDLREFVGTEHSTLELMVDVVLRYRPQSRMHPPRQRKARATAAVDKCKSSSYCANQTIG